MSWVQAAFEEIDREEQDRKRSMVEEEAPKPRPTPPPGAAIIDEQLFRQRWQEEMERVLPSVEELYIDNPAPETREKVRDRVNDYISKTGDFNRASDLLGATEAQIDREEDRLAAKIDEYLEVVEAKKEPPAELRAEIEAFNHEALLTEAIYQEMRDNSQSLDQPLDLKTAFEEIDRQSVSQERGRER